jgi:hypothetical protein
VVDVSAGGATTRNLVQQTNAVGRALTFPVTGHTVVVLTIGGNDLQASIISGDPTGESLDAAMLAIRRMVTFFQDPANFADGTSIYLADVYDPSDGEAYIDGCFLGLMLPELVDALFVWRDRYIELGTEMGFAVIDMLGQSLVMVRRLHPPERSRPSRDPPPLLRGDGSELRRRRLTLKALEARGPGSRRQCVRDGRCSPTTW